MNKLEYGSLAWRDQWVVIWFNICSVIVAKVYDTCLREYYP